MDDPLLLSFFFEICFLSLGYRLCVALYCMRVLTLFTPTEIPSSLFSFPETNSHFPYICTVLFSLSRIYLTCVRIYMFAYPEPLYRVEIYIYMKLNQR